jgi:hypothetical protein
MRRIVMFFMITAIIADSAMAFETRLRIKNESTVPAKFAVSLTRYRRGDAFGRWWPFLGHIGADGFVEKGNPKVDPLKPGATSPWVKLPTSGVCVRLRQISVPSSKNIAVTVDVEILDKGGVAAKRTIEYKRSDTDRLNLMTYNYPITGRRNFEIRTAEESVARNIEIAGKVAKEFEKPKVCEKIILYGDWEGRGIAEKDYPGLNDAHIALFKKLGLNGVRSEDFPWMKRNGVNHLKITGLNIGVTYDVKKARKRIRSRVLSLVGRLERHDMFEKISFMKLADEIPSGPLSAFINNPRAPILIKQQMSDMEKTPSDAGLKKWSDLKLAPAAVLKQKNPKLFYWTNIARMRVLSSAWKATMKLHHKYNPKALMSPNWPLGGILDGGYEGEGWDQWMIYRDKALNFNWGEDWTGYQWSWNGITSFLVDMMRSQSKESPLGVYNVAEVSHTPMFVHFKAYAELIRGVTQMEFYTYGPIRGCNESTPWSLKEDMVAEVGRIARETAEAEPYLTETRLVPAKTAMLWTASQQIWNPDRQQGSFISLYYALLHSNHNFDIISNYDIDATELDAYKVLYMPYEYVKSSTWAKIADWTKRGGTLVLCDPNLRNEYNETINLEDFPSGFKVERVKDCPVIGRLPLEFPKKKKLDQTKPVEFPVVCFKSKLISPENAEVILKYADDSPAVIKAKVGTGRVVAYGFQPGLSYVWEQGKRDKVRWGSKLIFHDFPRQLGDFITKPIAESGLGRMCGVDQPTVVVRERRGKTKDCIALFDYSFGASKAVEARWNAIGETTVLLSLNGTYKNIRSLRGKIVKRWSENGKTRLKLKFKAVDMILLDK